MAKCEQRILAQQKVIKPSARWHMCLLIVVCTFEPYIITAFGSSHTPSIGACLNFSEQHLAASCFTCFSFTCFHDCILACFTLAQASFAICTVLLLTSQDFRRLYLSFGSSALLPVLVGSFAWIRRPLRLWPFRLFPRSGTDRCRSVRLTGFFSARLVRTGLTVTALAQVQALHP